jgi:hypothetical protein
MGLVGLPINYLVPTISGRRKYVAGCYMAGREMVYRKAVE